MGYQERQTEKELRDRARETDRGISVVKKRE